MSFHTNPENVQFKHDSKNDETAPTPKSKKRVHQLSDSDTEKENGPCNGITVESKITRLESDSESESNIIPTKSSHVRSRIKMNESSSDSDASTRNKAVKNDEQQTRMKNKRDKLQNKFKDLLNSREKSTPSLLSSSKQSSDGHSENSDPSDSEMSSIAKIKQKIKKSMASVSSICDPDTSDEEDQMHKKELPKLQSRKQQKSTKLIEPKPIRMSAKQAMENMQLIKSESNRMLREKAVSLPYHRPKALSLKDIMARRKPAVTLDGKALPIKMNEEQLKHYALLLDQRNKEMMELCQSESEEEEETPTTEEKIDQTNAETDSVSSNNHNTECISTENATSITSGMENEPIDASIGVETKIIQEDESDKISPKEPEILTEEVNDKQMVDSANIEVNSELESENKNDSNTDFKLVYNDSVEEENVTTIRNKEDAVQNEVDKNDYKNLYDLESHSKQNVTEVNTEAESQLISLNYTENDTEPEKLYNPTKSNEKAQNINIAEETNQEDFFSDDDVNMDDIDKIIENAEIMKDDDNIDSPMLMKNPQASNIKPKLMGTPGMVIDLDGGNIMQKKITGVELLKERFIYFSRLKTPEELEREREKKLKPGTQHLKLKQELEEQIAEQRSLEWAKRLEEEKQQHMEMDTILNDAEDSIEKIETKLKEIDSKEDESSSENEEEDLEEYDVEIKDKPRKYNPMVDDEAEESDGEDNEVVTANKDINDDDDGNDDDNESSDEESSESEEEETTIVKKGRILKAFEDSDDEDVITSKKDKTEFQNDIEANAPDSAVFSNETQSPSQDDVIQLAQKHQSVSDDLFTSQDSSTVQEVTKHGDEVLGTQTFSILESTSNNIDMEFKSPSQINALCMSQPYNDPNVNNLVDGSQLPITQSSQSQPMGEDILALCTGNFYDNEFVSLTEENQNVDGMSQDSFLINHCKVTHTDKPVVVNEISEVDIDLAKTENIIKCDTLVENKEPEENNKKSNADGNLLESILGELDDPEFDKPKPNKFFTGNTVKEKVTENTQIKKRFIIDSDDETAEINVESDKRKNKKLKKKKLEQRALHISDDEDEEEEIEQENDFMSDLEEETERLVEYDSEENEIEVKPDKPKKKRKATDFFEQEAELTSEDEWVGSGDEDEKGLDRMEREEGDDDVFHEGTLRKELGQIHMRDVLDQDKREVRLIQELLFEDGDLGGGHRQRKFRWRNTGEDDDIGATNHEFVDTQEEEFESEEQWRKQRHEREVFLRQLQQEEAEGLNVSVNRTTIIKANLSSKSMSTLLQEVNQSKTEKTDSPIVQKKQTGKDIPSPKKSFTIFQQNYHGSLLTRGRGALARLAALATPLAADDDAPKIGSLATHKRNFVFTALTPDDDVPKVTIKRKADSNLGTPKLMKKMKIEEKQNHTKSSLLDHLNL